jgi:hypothetical protein
MIIKNNLIKLKNYLGNKVNNFFEKNYSINNFKTTLVGIALLGGIAFSNFYNNYINSNYNLNNTKNHIESLHEYKNYAENFQIKKKDNQIYLTIVEQKKELNKQISKLEKPNNTYTVKKNDGLEKIARNIEGNNWKEGLKTLCDKLGKDYPYSTEGKKWFYSDGKHSLKPDAKNPHYLPLIIKGKPNTIDISKMPSVKDDINKYNNTLDKLNQEKKTLEEKIKTINPTQTIKNDELTERIQQDILKYEQVADNQKKQKTKNGVYSLLSLISTFLAGRYLFKNRKENGIKKDNPKKPKEVHILPIIDSKKEVKKVEEKTPPIYQKKADTNIYNDLKNKTTIDYFFKIIENEYGLERADKLRKDYEALIKKPISKHTQDNDYNQTKRDYKTKEKPKKTERIKNKSKNLNEYKLKESNEFNQRQINAEYEKEKETKYILNLQKTKSNYQNKNEKHSKLKKINYEKIKKEYDRFQRRKQNYETYKKIMNFREQNKYARFDTYNTVKYQSREQNISEKTFRRDIKWYENYLKNNIKNN